MVFFALLLLALAALPAQEPEVRFVAYDVVVDTGGRALAAYQFEVSCDDEKGKIVGVEGGVGPHFAPAPYYDPAALRGGRIVVAAFTTEPDAPSGKVRVARLHMQETGRVHYASNLVAAAQPGGARFDAKIEIVHAGGNK